MNPFSVFVGSSTEGSEIARNLIAALSEDPLFRIRPWWDVFPPSVSFFDALIAASQHVDFAIFVATGDDILVSRGAFRAVARDNVMFEFALFTGELGKRRVLLVRTVEALPTDLDGISTIRFDEAAADYRALAAQCIHKLLVGQVVSPRGELLYELLRRANSRTLVDRHLVRFHEQVSIALMPKPAPPQAVDVLEIFQRVRSDGAKLLPGGRDWIHHFFEFANLQSAELRRLSSVMAAQILSVAKLRCERARCATRIAIWREDNLGNLQLLMWVIEQCGLRPILVDVERREVIGPYAEGEKAVLAYAFLNTGFRALECVDVLRRHGLVVNHIVALCARRAKLAHALASAKAVNIEVISCFLISESGEVEAFQ